MKPTNEKSKKTKIDPQQTVTRGCFKTCSKSGCKNRCYKDQDHSGPHLCTEHA